MHWLVAKLTKWNTSALSCHSELVKTLLTSPFVTGLGQSWSQRVTVKLAPQRLVAVTGLANKPTLLQWQTQFVNTTKQVCYLYKNPLSCKNKHTLLTQRKRFHINTLRGCEFRREAFDWPQPCRVKVALAPPLPWQFTVTRQSWSQSKASGPVR